MKTSPVGHSLDELNKVFDEIPLIARKAVDVSDMTKLSPEEQRAAHNAEYLRTKLSERRTFLVERQRAEINAMVDARLAELGYGPVTLSDGFCPSLPSETKAGGASSPAREGDA